MAPSFIIFIAGASATFGSDWVVARFYPNDMAAQWMVVKSTTIIGAVILTFGFERGFLRRMDCRGHILRHTLANIFLLLPVFISIVFLIADDIILAACIGAASAGIALSLTVSEAMRSVFHMAYSQLAMNAWKLILLLLLIGSGPALKIKTPPEFLILMAALISVAFIAKPLIAELRNESKRISYFELLSEVRLFAMFNLLLVASTYLDQLVVGSISNGYLARSYLAHSTIFMAPLILVAAFLGFQLAPRVRHPNFTKILRPNLIVLLSIGAICTGIFISSLTGDFLVAFAYGGEVKFDLNIASLMIAIGIFRVIYAIPSSVLGVLGSPKDLNRFFMINLTLLIFQIAATMALLKTEIPTFLAILLPSLIHWAGKSMQGIYQARAAALP